jgi:hypothetical protein
MTIKKMFPSLITAISVFALTCALHAQVKNSVYSMFGVGQIAENGFGINKALGGTGIAFQSGRSVNYANPASYLGIPPHSFSMELGMYGILNRSENKTLSQVDSDFNFGYCSMNLYVTNRWAAILGVVPYSSVDYEINSSDEIEGELISFEKNYTGSGGLNKLYLGNSFGIYNGLTFGFNAAFIFGPITQTEAALSTGSFSGYKIINHRTAHSFYMDYGLQYSMRKHDWLYTIGLIYGASKKLTTSDALEFTYDGETTTLEHGNGSDIRIPEKRGIGVSVKKGAHFRAGIDYEWKKWSTINFSNPNLDTKNSNRFSIGLEYSPLEKDNWLDGLLYRLGAHYKNSYLEINNTQINSMGVVFGIGVPNKVVSNFNLSVEYGKEGTLNNGLIRNNYWMLDFSFSVFEFWGKRR